ncbi:Protein BONZAI 3, partial [Tetrabaena socialis]
PSFMTRPKLLYNFERLQRFKLLVVDINKGQDPKTVSPSSCENLGSAEFLLSEVVVAKGKKLGRTLSLPDGRPSQSTAVLVVEELANCKETFKIMFKATRIKNIERFGKSDPFLQISRAQDDTGAWVPVYKTAVRKDNLNPAWDEAVVRAAQLNNGDMVRPLLVQVFDYEVSGAHRELGRCEMSTERMQELAAQHGAVVSLLPPPGKKPGDYGALQITQFKVETRSTFIDYISGGTEIGFVVAVDFTASNGDPRNQSSKHYLAGGPTQYEQAVMGIGQVIEYYDYDKLFPMYGFGGQYQRNPTDHCFPMGAPPESTCAGVNGLLQAYRQALSTWTLSGPTLFAPVIRMASQLARPTVGAKPPKYTVLLILTDGAIMDMADTINAIIDASALPLSVLIVGVGKDDFGSMKTLDGDQQRLRSGDRTAVRDIVQFVEFQRFAGDGVLLAQELLAELPGQLLDYMRTNNIDCPTPLVAAPTMGASAPPVPPGAQIPAHGVPVGAYPQPGAPQPGVPQGYP